MPVIFAMTTCTCLLHNLRITMNAPLLDLPLADDAAAPADICITREEWTTLQKGLKQWHWVPAPYGQTGEAWFRLLEARDGDETLYCLDFANDQGGRAAFVVRHGGSEVLAAWDIPGMSKEAAGRIAGEVLATRVLGFALRLGDRLSLHGSAVALAGKAIGFLGGSGAGKSTLTAALIACGYPLVADDRIVMQLRDDAYLVQPGSRNLRLWPQSLTALNFDVASYPPLFSGTDKRSLALPETDSAAQTPFSSQATPLGALYILLPRNAELSQSSIHAMPLPVALHHLLANRYGPVTPPPTVVANEYRQLGRLVQHIPVRLIQRPDNLDALSPLVQQIVADVAAHAAPLPRCRP